MPRSLTVRLLPALCLVLAGSAQAELERLVDAGVLAALAAETSGEAAKRNLDFVTLMHRMRSGRQFDEATDHILGRLKDYGLDRVETLEYAADGRRMYGTQRSRPLWAVTSAELWELGEQDGESLRLRRLCDWQSVPLCLAQDSLAGEVTTTLVDIGAGTADADYAGKDIAGKLVLTSSQPGDVVGRAVGEHGAAGILSYAPNQRSAWWLEDERLLRWGHLSSFPETRTFGFMITLREARDLKARLAAGEEIRLEARVDARHTEGVYRFATAAIDGAHEALRREEIVFTCHLDHPRPGANDNASGCVAILEVARALKALIDDGRLARPARTLRFLWPAEIEGSLMYLAEHDDVSRLKANLHMDMVGGAPVTKAVFRISGGPASLPTFIADLGEEIGRFVNAQTLAHAGGATVPFPLVAPEGGREPLLAQFEGLDMGSDHDVFREGSFRVPGLYLHDWPDRYIHTNFDLAANIDPTKLKRAAFIGAVAGLFLADFGSDDVAATLALLRQNALARSAVLLEQLETLDPADAAEVARIHFDVERARVESLTAFAEIPATDRYQALAFLANLQTLIEQPATPRAPADDTVFRRNPAVRGPMHAFGYSYIRDELGDEAYEALALPRYRGKRGSGGEYAYEALNLVDGQRTVSEIRHWLTAELGPVPLAPVREYLDALAAIGVVTARE